MSQNKFLEKYPQLIIFNIGDKVRVIKALNAAGQEVDTWMYKKGDIGVIYRINSHSYDVLFNNKGPYTVYPEEIVPYYE
jgi:ribosomal protein L21E